MYSSRIVSNFYIHEKTCQEILSFGKFDDAGRINFFCKYIIERRSILFTFSFILVVFIKFCYLSPLPFLGANTVKGRVETRLNKF